MVFVSNISSVVKEANPVVGFGLDPQFAETLSELLSRVPCGRPRFPNI
jgi:hypothetical protein